MNSDEAGKLELPHISAVDLIDLRGVEANRVNLYLESAPNAPFVTVTGPVAEEIAAMWCALPSDETARCHVPPIGLRFYSDGINVCQGSICWHCNNIFGKLGEKELFYAFDGKSPEAVALHQKLREIIGGEVLDAEIRDRR